MIAFLRGKVIRRETDLVVLDVQGVGYEVFCTVRTTAHLSVGEKSEFHVHTAVSDDAIRFYGFSTTNELRLFRLLIGVERIGPKAALAILGRGELHVVSRAIAEGDAVLLATVPGVGRKTADRVVLELKGKLDWIAPVNPGAVDPGKLPPSHQDAITALIGLGFREEQARHAVGSSRSETDDTATLITAALRELDTVR